MSRTSALLPIIIGITGHRDPQLDVIPKLKEKLSAVLERIDRAAPNSPIVFLSPLAAGCDQLAAIVAVNFTRLHHAQGMKIELVIPLPFQLDEYRKDFSGDLASLAEFERLRGCASFEFVLPPFKCPSSSEQIGVQNEEMRKAHYRRLGLYIALQSQVMVAMWDGLRIGKVGGTGEIADFCLGTNQVRQRTPSENASVAEWASFASCQIPFRPVMPLLSPQSSTPLLVFETPRLTSKNLDGEAKKLEAENDRKLVSLCSEFERTTEQLNVALMQTTVTYPSDFRNVLDTPRWHQLVDRFEHLDALANKFKSFYLKDARLIAFFAVLAICFFEFFSSFSFEYQWAKLCMLTYVALLVLSFCIWKRSTNRQCEKIFVHSRGLAEAMRIQLAWVRAGVQESVADHYVARRGLELVDLQTQIRAASIDGFAIQIIPTEETIQNARRVWISKQSDYFAESLGGMKRRKRSDMRGQWLRLWSVRIALIFAFVLGVLVVIQAVVIGSVGTAEGFDWWVNFGCFIMAALFAASVGIDYVRNVALDHEDLEIAKRMLPLYQRATELMEGARTMDDRKELLRVIGKEALDESAECIARHRGRLKALESG